MFSANKMPTQLQKLPDELQLATANHVKYIQSLNTRKDEYDYWLTEHLRLNGVYWGLVALHLLGHPDALPRDETIDFVLSCQHKNGGFGAAPGHDAHMLYTVSAVQILAMVDGFDELEKRGTGKAKVAECEYTSFLILRLDTFPPPADPSPRSHMRWTSPHSQPHPVIANLQNKDTGTFSGDEWGEEDTRFVYGAFNALSLLHLLHLVDVDRAVDHIVACANFDGGYGVTPGAESHSGQIFTCVAALAIAGRLDLVDADRLGRWLSERQVAGGGLNGRPEKQEDSCYSWWVLSSLRIIGRVHWIDRDALVGFLLRCQDTDGGGIADRPGDMVDVWHTCFGMTGLSLLDYPGTMPVNPVYCMPVSTIEKVLGKSS